MEINWCSLKHFQHGGHCVLDPDSSWGARTGLALLRTVHS